MKTSKCSSSESETLSPSQTETCKRGQDKAPAAKVFREHSNFLLCNGSPSEKQVNWKDENYGKDIAKWLDLFGGADLTICTNI